MEMMIDRNADAAEKYELKSDGIVAEIEDKLFMIVTYGPESRYYLADIHAGRIVAAISMFEGCKCVLAYDDAEGWRIDAIDENGNHDGSIKLCRTGIDLNSMGIRRNFQITAYEGANTNEQNTEHRQRVAYVSHQAGRNRGFKQYNL